MTKNMERMSYAELQALAANVERATIQARNRDIQIVREKVEHMVKASGFTMKEMFGRGRGVIKGTKVAAKYMNPDSPSETWTGRGRRPRWLAAKIKSGAKQEDFLLK